jgi:hypothetical protein
MGLVVVTPPPTAGAAASPTAFTVELGWFNTPSGCEWSPSADVEVLSAFSTSISANQSVSVTATMPFDTHSMNLNDDARHGMILPLVCAWFFPAGAKAGTSPVFYDRFHNVRVTGYLFQYELSTGTSVQVIFTPTTSELFFLTTGSTTPTTSDLIANGNFSLPVVNGYETFEPLAKATLPSAANSIHGWTVGGNSVDLMGNAYWKPLPPGSPSDSQSVDLSGAAPGSITQTVSTTAGTSYLLTWWEAGNPQGGQPVKVMDVSWNKTSKAYPAPSTKGHSLGHMSWSQKSQVVVASSAQSVLEFADATPDQSAYGAVVADVSLTPDTSA